MSIAGKGRTAHLTIKFPGSGPGTRGALALVRAAARCGPRLVSGYAGAALVSTHVSCHGKRHH